MLLVFLFVYICTIILTLLLLAYLDLISKLTNCSKILETKKLDELELNKFNIIY